VVLAVGIVTATNLFTVAVLADAVFSAGPGLSENATQVLTGWGGGIIGVIGAVVGYRVGQTSEQRSQAAFEAGAQASSSDASTPQPGAPN
jgi:hypothetical protein